MPAGRRRGEDGRPSRGSRRQNPAYRPSGLFYTQKTALIFIRTVFSFAVKSGLRFFLFRAGAAGGQLDLFNRRGGSGRRGRGLGLARQALETLVELRQLTAAIDHAMQTRPRRMRLRINIQMQLGTRFAIGAAGFEFGAIRHQDNDGMIVGVTFFFHRTSLWFKIGPLSRENPRKRQAFCATNPKKASLRAFGVVF